MQMTQTPPEIEGLAAEIRVRLGGLGVSTTAAVRAVRREFTRRIAGMDAESVVALALELLRKDSGVMRFFAYELVNRHKAAMGRLATEDLLRLGQGLDSWSSVDCFAMYLAGPVWARGGVGDKTVAGWSRSKDRWWRRTALVSTVALSRRGSEDDVVKVKRVCGMLVADRDDMVVKALSWALRELAKKHPEEVWRFLAERGELLAARVTREVKNKLRTGLKSGRIKTAWEV